MRGTPSLKSVGMELIAVEACVSSVWAAAPVVTAVEVRPLALELGSGVQTVSRCDGFRLLGCAQHAMLSS
jgi:hypothetical protein